MNLPHARIRISSEGGRGREASAEMVTVQGPGNIIGHICVQWSELFPVGHVCECPPSRESASWVRAVGKGIHAGKDGGGDKAR